MNSNSDESHKKNGLTWIVLALLACLAIVFFPRSGKVRFGSHLNQCYQNHREIAKAILAYEQAHGHFPSPYLVGDNPDLLHSWRVLILPYIGHRNLYEEYRFDEPWDGPNNVRLASRMPSIYRCPHDHTSSGQYETSYIVVTGSNTMWPTDRQLKLTEIVDKPKETALLLEFTNNRVNWMSPVDIPISDIFNEAGACKMMPSSNHKGNAFVVSYAQGYTEVLEDVTCDILRAILTINGNENINWKQMAVVPNETPIPEKQESPENPK